MDRISRRKIKGTEELSYVISQVNLTDTHRACPQQQNDVLLTCKWKVLQDKLRMYDATYKWFQEQANPQIQKAD